MDNQILIDEVLQRAEDAVMGRDYQKAKDEYYKAIELGSKKALCFLGNLYADKENNVEKAFELYQQAVDEGESYGYIAMADYYTFKTYEVDFETAEEYKDLAFSYLEKAHEAGNIQGSYEYASALSAYDKDNAKLIFEGLTKTENPYKGDAYVSLSRLYMENGVVFDEKEYLDLLFKAAQLSDFTAFKFLGDYASQKKLPQLANAYYGKAIEIGEAEGFSPYFMDQLKSSISSLASSIQPPLDYEGFIKFCK